MRHTILTAIIVILLYGCSKKSGPGPSPITIPQLPPVVTPVGTTTGSPVKKTIGAAGGTILSADGRIELSFPAGALAANTDITIQPVTNTAPNGSGVGYHLMPDGSKFGAPVSLIFHYTDADANGTSPLLFYIAFQDSTGVWQADFKNREVDTVARTVRLSISHFSFWSLGSSLYLFPNPPGVKQNQTSDLGVVIVNDQGDPTPNAGGEFSLSAMPSVIPIPNQSISNWSINGVPGGNAQNGTLSGTDSKETYKAPASIDKERTVQASATVSTSVKGWNKGKQVLQTNKFIVFTNIELLPQKMSFLIDMALTITKTSNVYYDIYTDEGTFQVDVENGKVTCSNFSNHPPNVTPPSGSSGLTQADWINDGIGLVNFNQGLGVLGYMDTLAIYIGHTGTVTPKWRITNTADGSSYTTGGEAVPGYPSGIIFVAKDSAQQGTYSNGGTLSYTWTATPIH